MKREEPKMWTLPTTRQPTLWSFWKTRVHPPLVDGLWDGTLAWSDTAPSQHLGILSGLFFGESITTEHYIRLCELNLIPRSIMPNFEAWIISQSQKVKVVEPVPVQPKRPCGRPPKPVVVKVKKQKKIKPPKPPKKHRYHVTIMKAFSNGVEVGRASIEPDGSWKAVEYIGVSVKQTRKVPTLQQAMAWLWKLPRVNKVSKVKQEIDPEGH
jgi:hypothetical protein